MRSRAAFWRWALGACPGRRRSRNGATASCSCAAPRARTGRTFRTPRSTPIAGWLAPYLTGKTRLDEIGADDLSAALQRACRWALARRLDARGADAFRRRRPARRPPSTTRPRADPRFRSACRSCSASPRTRPLAGGKIPLTLNLLSPAHRPIQITRDLPGFWRGSWAAVRADLRGRYPAPLLAGRPGERRSDGAGQAAGDVSLRRPRTSASRALP